MDLKDYINNNYKSQKAFGRRLKPIASQGLVSQWIVGKTRVTLDYALQISALSNDQVTPQDCADLYRPSESTELENAA